MHGRRRCCRGAGHLAILNTDVAQLEIFGVSKLPLQLVNRSKDQHLPMIILQLRMGEAAQAPASKTKVVAPGQL